MAPLANNEDLQLDMSQTIFTALISLGFNPTTIEQKERLPINEQIFKRMTQKAGDHIMYFLFDRISHQQVSQVFCDCWPIYDKKTEAHFRSAVFEWYKALNQNEHLNLKPVPVVTKAVVTPTSNKFLPTIYTLTRFALHSQILQMDPSINLVYLPTLAAKLRQRQKAMKLIVKCKVHHASHYIAAVGRRVELLKLCENKAKELVDKYRVLVKEREAIHEEVNNCLMTSEFLPPAFANTLATFPLDQFCQELESRIKSKNGEIGDLWKTMLSLKQIDEETWPKLSALLKGDKGLTTINGEDYSNLLSKEGRHVQGLVTEIENCYNEGKLDLVSLFKCSAVVLKSLRAHTQQSCHLRQDEEARMNEAKSRSKRVKTLQEETLKIRETLGAAIFPLLDAVTELRKTLDDRFHFSPSSASFNLCPPTPLLTLEDDSHLESLHRSRSSRYSDRNHSYLDGQHCTVNLPSSSPFLPNLSRHTLGSSSKQKSDNVNCIFPTGQIPSISPGVSSALDSGCGLSGEADSLLRSIEQLDITPQNKKSVLRRSAFHRSGSVSLDQSLFAEQEKKRLVFDQSDIGPSEVPVLSSSSDTPSKRRHATPEGRPEEEDFSLGFGGETISSTTNLASTRKEDSESNALRKGHSHSFHAECFKLEQRLMSSRTESDVEQMNVEEDSRLVDPFSSDVGLLPSTAAGARSEADAAQNNKNFYATIASLESLLDKMEDETASYDFHLETFASKNSTKEFSLWKETSDESEHFVDGKSFLDSRAAFVDPRPAVGQRESASRFLPEGSLFDTLTDSLTAGELESEMLLDCAINDELRRESLDASRRDSVLSLSNRLSEASPVLLDLLSKSCFSEKVAE